MTEKDFTTSILVDKTSTEVFEAINNVRGWWSEEIGGVTDQLNAEFTYRYEDVHLSKMKITELIPDKIVAWEVLDNYFKFTKDKHEWKGDTITFDLSEKDGKTQLQFTQVGLSPEYECYDICQGAWTNYIQKSLHDLITTGTGHPNGKQKPQTEDERNLTTTDFTTAFLVDRTPAEVFEAVNNVRGWWQGEVKGGTHELNDVFSYRMKDIHFSEQRLVELQPNKKVVWLVTDSKLNFLKEKNEWTGTKICFEISEADDKTQLRFTHVGLSPNIECYNSCSNGWTKLIQQSLFSLVTTGKGKNVF